MSGPTWQHELKIDLASLTVQHPFPIIQFTCRGVAQPGRALGSGPRGRRFESSRPDQKSQTHK